MMSEKYVAEYVEIIDGNGERKGVCVTDIEHTVSFEVTDEYVAMELCDLLNEQQATISLLLDLLYESEATVINEYSSHIGEDMDKLDKIFKEKDIKEIERFVRGCDDE